MALLEPIHGEPAAVADLEDERLLVIADYHAGFEAALRYEEGIQLSSRASERKERVIQLLADTRADRLVILGDVTHSIGKPGGAERGELEVLLEAIEVPVTIAKGNHDGVIEDLLGADNPPFEQVTVTPATGGRLGALGVVHGHSWPDIALLESEILCVGHEHPSVKLTDEVGGTRIERVWLRGELHLPAFGDRPGLETADPPELVVCPAFNELCGGTWVNMTDQEFLSPFLPAALPRGEVYLLDGTNLGDYREI